MKILFFDMEFANGKMPGSVYSFGYVRTDRRFRLTEPQTDLLINPDCAWNDYVRQHILAYPMTTVRQASLFPAYYKRIKKLLCRSTLVVGFAVNNDTTALRRACERYGLQPLRFRCLDLERVCRSLRDYPQAHGLDGYVRAYTGIEPSNRHRSDGDAYATMMLLQAICEKHGIAPKDVERVFASAFIDSIPPEKKPQEGEPTTEQESAQAGKQGSRRKRSRKKKPAQGDGTAQTQPSDPAQKPVSQNANGASAPNAPSQKKKKRRRCRHRRPSNSGGTLSTAAQNSTPTPTGQSE